MNMQWKLIFAATSLLGMVSGSSWAQTSELDPTLVASEATQDTSEIPDLGQSDLGQPDLDQSDFGWPDLGWVDETENAIQIQYRENAARFAGDWGGLPQGRIAAGPPMREGASGARVAELRNRLGLTQGSQFDSALADRISAYRAAHGLPRARTADAALTASLNRGHGHYQRIIDANIARAARLPAQLGGKLGARYVLVDSAEQRLYMYQADKIIGTMRVVVGKPSDQTPQLQSRIDHVVLNPYWNVPPDLTQTRYAQRVLRGGESYLRTRGFEALSDWTDSARVLGYKEVDWKAVAAGETQLRLRQLPGPGNGMGKIKIMFDNSFGVYLHDTPSVALFKKSDRTLSAGCVRLEKPWLLAEWLFGYRPQLSGSAAEQVVPLAQSVPVYLVYFTAVPSGNGFDFRDDIYGLDGAT